VIKITRPAERPYFLEGIEYLEILDGDGHYLQLPKLTTAQRDALSATEGMMIYNTDTGQVEAYQDGSWSAVGGAGTFTDLTDTPSSYIGRGGDVVLVKTTEDGIETQPWPVTGAALNFFLSDDAADIGTYYYMYPTESGNGYSELTSPSLSTGDDQLLWAFVTEAGEPGVEVLALGAYTATLFLKKTGNKDVRLYWKLFKRDTGGTETEILQSAVSDYLTADNSQYLISAYLNEDQVLDPTDRLVLKLYANVSGTGTDVTVTLTMEGDYDSRLTINVLSSAFNLDRLSDVTITSPADNDFLAYDYTSGKWINQTPSEAGILAADGSVPLSGDLDVNGYSFNNVKSILTNRDTELVRLQVIFQRQKGRYDYFPWIFDGNVQFTLLPPLIAGDAGSYLQRARPCWLRWNGKHYIYYEGELGEWDFEIGCLEADDLEGPWTDHEQVLAKGTAGEWDAGYVADPCAFVHDGMIRLFYEGGADHTYPSKIGMASSFSPTSGFSKSGLVLSPTAGTWDANTVHNPEVFPIGNKFYMLYAGANSDYDYEVGLAVSTNLTVWTKEIRNPVIAHGWDPDGGTYNYVRPSPPMRIGDTWWMCLDGKDSGGNRTKLLAASKDLIYWEKVRTITISLTGDWTSFYPTGGIFAWGDRIYLLGEGKNNGVRTIGLAYVEV